MFFSEGEKKCLLRTNRCYLNLGQLLGNVTLPILLSPAPNSGAYDK